MTLRPMARFVLDGVRLDYYESDAGGALRGSVDLTQARDARETPAGTFPHTASPPDRWGCEVETPKRTYYIRWEHEDEYEHWLRALRLVLAGGEGTLTGAASKCTADTLVLLGLREQTAAVAELAERVVEGHLSLDTGVWSPGLPVCGCAPAAASSPDWAGGPKSRRPPPPPRARTRARAHARAGSRCARCSTAATARSCPRAQRRRRAARLGG
jgi:hypothetical protein